MIWLSELWIEIQSYNQNTTTNWAKNGKFCTVFGKTNILREVFFEIHANTTLKTIHFGFTYNSAAVESLHINKTAICHKTGRVNSN